MTISIDDLVDACVFLMTKYDYRDIGELINIGAGIDVKIKDVTAMVKQIVGFQGSIIHDLSKPDGTPRKLLDVSRIKSLGWESRTGLEEGLRKTYNAYVKHSHSKEHR